MQMSSSIHKFITVNWCGVFLGEKIYVELVRDSDTYCCCL